MAPRLGLLVVVAAACLLGARVVAGFAGLALTVVALAREDAVGTDTESLRGDTGRARFDLKGEIGLTFRGDCGRVRELTERGDRT